MMQYHDAKAEAVAQALKNRLVDLKQKISAKRKEGGYTSIAELLLMNIPAKIRLFEIDGSDSQKVAIEKAFAQAEEDLSTQYP